MIISFRNSDIFIDKCDVGERKKSKNAFKLDFRYFPNIFLGYIVLKTPNLLTRRVVEK